MKIAPACRLFGHCRQAYYQSKADIESELLFNKRVIADVKSIRSEDPRIGAYKLWLMLCAVYGRNNLLGRDSFFELLRRHKLMLPPPKPRHTTNSNHRYHKWKNLVRGFVPLEANSLWVSDITYISLEGGNVCYLHLITDGYSRKIVGWILADTLRAAISIQALQMAIEQTGGISLEGLIHHSDRGVQYCCDDYVAVLQKHHIRISMTEDYKPTDNALAERVNGTIKTERIYPGKTYRNIEHARNVIGRFIHFYNYRRPHMSIGYKIPAVVHTERGPQKKMWKAKIYTKKMDANGNNDISLQSRTTGPDDSCSHQTGKSI